MIELTDLSSDHIDLQISTINWYRNIPELFEQNASFFETYKSQFEEHLQQVTKKLTEDIDAIVPNISVINDMDETEKLREYYATVKNYMQNLKCFDDYVRWINKEEKLFKFPVTQYPILDELKGYVEPFAELLRLVS